MSCDPYRGHAPPPPPQSARHEDGSHTLIRIVRLVTGIAASVFILHIALTVLGANEANEFVEFVYNFARTLVLDLGAVFTPGDATLRVVLNYGSPRWPMSSLVT